MSIGTPPVTEESMAPSTAGVPPLAALVLIALFAQGCEETDAVQTMYRDGVPHTDSMGRPRFAYDAGQSFFPIGIYHALTGQHYGRDYSFAPLAEAGFNTVHTWEMQSLSAVINDAEAHGLQVIYHYPTDAEVDTYADHPNLLAWYLDEEPTGLYELPDLEPRLAAFRARREAIRSRDPTHPVIIIDGPARESRKEQWLDWAAAGDVSSHFFYPVVGDEVRSIDVPRSIPQSVTRAVEVNGGAKPVWFLVQAFSGPLFGWSMPSPMQLRAITYAAVIHGATGIIFFAFDNFVMRDGDILGMAPDPLPEYGPTGDFNDSGTPVLVATEEDLRASRALWAETTRLTGELAALTPALLSPTSRLEPKVRVVGDAVSETPIRVLLKEIGGEFVLLAVNLDDVTLEVSFQFDAEPRDLRVIPADGTDPKGTDLGWRDTFPGFAGRAYRFRLPGSGS